MISPGELGGIYHDLLHSARQTDTTLAQSLSHVCKILLGGPADGCKTQTTILSFTSYKFVRV